MNSKKITISALFLSLYVMIAFLLHLILYTTSGLVYCALIAFCAAGMGISKPIVRKVLPNHYILIWLGIILTLWINYIARYHSKDVLIDNIVFTCGFLMILFLSVMHENYKIALSLILFMAFFFATGVYLQRFVPNIYKVILSVFPSEFRNSLSIGQENAQRVQGFTINSGFTANYIMVGIFVIISRIMEKSLERNLIIRICYLAIALIMTGKRGPLFFLMLSAFLVCIIPVRGTKRMKRVWNAFLVFLVFVVLFFLLGDYLEQIPFFGRYIASINGFFSGEDISSGRLGLYSWAIQLFLRNPLLGIGWGKYRTTVAGNATFVKSLDAHNVYLQLLCETGIVGFLIFVIMFIMSWNMTKDAYCACLRTSEEDMKKWKPELFFSFMFQTYFLFYSLTGNPLYDQFYQILFIFSCSIMIAYRYISSYKHFQQ